MRYQSALLAAILGLSSGAAIGVYGGAPAAIAAKKGASATAKLRIEGMT